MLTLNLRLFSINFSSNIINPNDTIRVSITTIPDNQKHAFTFEAKDINNSEHLFRINYSERTKTIIVCFRKKEFFSNGDIFASTCIQSKDINENNEAYMKIDLYEPLMHSDTKDNSKTKKERKIIGNMKINWSIKEHFVVKNYGVSLDNIEQRTLRRKLNNKRNPQNEQYIFN